MISKEEVLRIAKLARLELADTEVEKMRHNLSQILDYFEVLKKAPQTVTTVPLTSATAVPENMVRKDEVAPRPSSFAGELMQAVPKVKDGYIKVKQVLK